MPFVRKRRIWWENVPEATSYVVYVSKERSYFDPPNFAWEATPGIIFKLVDGKTELIIPDEWPEFPREPGAYLKDPGRISFMGEAARRRAETTFNVEEVNRVLLSHMGIE